MRLRSPVVGAGRSKSAPNEIDDVIASAMAVPVRRVRTLAEERGLETGTAN